MPPGSGSRADLWVPNDQPPSIMPIHLSRATRPEKDDRLNALRVHTPAPTEPFSVHPGPGAQVRSPQSLWAESLLSVSETQVASVPKMSPLSANNGLKLHIVSSP